MNISHSRFNVKEYVDACEQSAKRTRWVVIVLVVACVLVFTGFYNSLNNAWMLQRIRAAYNPYSTFVEKKLNPEMNPAFKVKIHEKIPQDEFREEFQKALVRSYIDNTYFIRAPFFGIAFDINDLGLIGGGSLIAVLVLLRFCLSSEIRNLTFSFREATQHEKLYPFYHALAMHQVFTVPSMRNQITGRLLRIAPKLVYLLPVVIFSVGVAYDYYTVLILRLFSFTDNWELLTIELIFLGLIAWLSWKCHRAQCDIDDIWETYWPRAFGLRSRVVLLDPFLMEFFKNDSDVNIALRQSIGLSP